ncbi:hypothetical protein FEM08_22300 [Flavobacterium gilvum]|nr:hypothetical protein FEM08_22300 [Flavobacterium gilvum]
MAEKILEIIDFRNFGSIQALPYFGNDEGNAVLKSFLEM